MHTATAVQAGSAVAEQQQQTDPAQSEASVPESLVEDAIMELQGHTDRCMAQQTSAPHMAVHATSVHVCAVFVRCLLCSYYD